MSKELTREEKLTYIVKNELKITREIFNGHKASDTDKFSEIRKTIKNYRIDLGLIENKNGK